MPDDWFVPGAMLDVGERSGERVIRLRPPEHWPRVIVEVRRRAISKNDNKIRSHWRGFHTEKKAWQEEIEAELMVARTSRDNQRAIAGAFVRFPRRPSRPPDPGNYADLINKALGDALVNYGVIPDDDAAHYVFGGVEFEEEVGPARTRILIYVQPKEG